MHAADRSTTNHVTSADGTPIAFDRFGVGPPVIVVGGQLCDRTMTRPLAERLGEHCCVINPDRRGKGDSGDTPPYAIEREIEDLAALVADAGAPVSLYGHSSGAALVLHAAAHGLPLDRLVLHDPPYTPDTPEDRRMARAYAEELRAILADGRRGDAIALCLRTVGIQSETIDAMRSSASWHGLEASASALAYDSAIMGDDRGGTVPADLLAAVTRPVLVLVGDAGPAWMIDTAQAIAGMLADGRYRVLEGQEHVVAPEVLVPVLAEFLGR